MTEQTVMLGSVVVPATRLKPARGPRSWVRTYRAYLPFVIVGTLLGRAGQAYIHGALLLATMPLTLLLAVLVHELGHYVAARVHGFTVYAFGMGPYCLIRRDGQWHLYRGGGRSIEAFVVAAPPHAHDYRKRRAAVVAAGAIANIVAGLCLLVLSNTVRLAQPVDLMVLSLGKVSLFNALVQLTQATLHDVPSDGATLLRLLHRGRAGALYDMVSEIHCRILAGERPRDWDPALIQRIAAVPASAHANPLAPYYAYLHYFDRDDRVRERDLFDRTLAVALRMSASTAAGYVASLACFLAYRGEELAKCRDMLEILRACTIKEDLRQRLEVAVALAEGREIGQVEVRRVLEGLRTSWLTGLTLLEQEAFAALLGEPGIDISVDPGVRRFQLDHPYLCA